MSLCDGRNQRMRAQSLAKSRRACRLALSPPLRANSCTGKGILLRHGSQVRIPPGAHHIISILQTTRSTTWIRLRPTFWLRCSETEAFFQFCQISVACPEPQFPLHSVLGCGELLRGSPPHRCSRSFRCFDGRGDPAPFQLLLIVCGEAGAQSLERKLCPNPQALYLLVADFASTSSRG